MKITLEYTAVLDIRSVPNRGEVTLPAGTTVAGLLTHLGIQPGHQKYILASVQGAKKSASATLNDGEHVVLSLPMGGG